MVQFGAIRSRLAAINNREKQGINRCLRCLLLVMCTYPFARKALTLHLARGEGRERYFGCNLMQRKVLASSHQHLMAEAPDLWPISKGPSFGTGRGRRRCRRFEFSVRAGKTPSSKGMPRSRAETWVQARAAPGPERASPLRGGSPSLDSRSSRDESANKRRNHAGMVPADRRLIKFGARG